MKNHSLKGKNVVITGASSGIGKATAHYLAREGCNLILAARRELLLEEVALECEKFGVRALPYKTDVTKFDQVGNLQEFALTQLGHIDIWINNAGVGAVGEFNKTPVEVHEQVIKTNLISYIYGAYVILPHFKERQSGTLINNISLGGFVPSPFAVAYSASKFGLRGYAEALRYELSDTKGIHVCDVFPAFIDTPGPIHSSNYIGRVLRPTPPVYEPNLVAETIVSLCKKPRAQVMVGGSSRFAKLVHAVTPNLMGKVMTRFAVTYFKGAKQAEITEGNLFKPVWRGAGIHGGFKTFHPIKNLFRRA